MHPVVTWSLTDADQMEAAIFFSNDVVLLVEKQFCGFIVLPSEKACWF